MEKLLDKFLEMTDRVIALEIDNAGLSEENEALKQKLKESVEIVKVLECVDMYSSSSDLYVRENEKLKKLLRIDSEVKIDD